MNTLADIQNAAEILHGVAHVTPVLTSRTLNQSAGATTRRGLQVSWGLPCNRYAATSTGSQTHCDNFFRQSCPGVALACQLRGLAAHIVMTKPINPLKRQAVMDYRATIHEVTDGEEAERKLRDLQEQLNG